MTDRTANLTVLVAARAKLLASDDFSPANTRALNKIEAELDRFPHREVSAAIKAHDAQFAATTTSTAA